MPIPADSFQMQFERRWGHLNNPHVRALAWLLDAPDLLAPESPHWHGQIASLGPVTQHTSGWLAALQDDPAPLDAALGSRFYSRLGLYAEKLMAFYFEQHGLLAAHGLQVQASRNDTIGEFDFLLRQGDALLHWEFATKFYLLEGAPDAGRFNSLVGPNLADTLGLKMRKILDKQLSLALHPAAQRWLPQPVERAQALVKGWLFYPGGTVPAMEGISPRHNHGFWCALAQVAALSFERFIVMPKLLWLAPLKLTQGQVLSRQELQAHLAGAAAPVMVAAVMQHDGWEVEAARGFVVPDDWQRQAAERRLSGKLPA
nr:DUF1853 family protein [Janthinobacterium agaricidamnosum]